MRLRLTLSDEGSVESGSEDAMQSEGSRGTLESVAGGPILRLPSR